MDALGERTGRTHCRVLKKPKLICNRIHVRAFWNAGREVVIESDVGHRAAQFYRSGHNALYEQHFLFMAKLAIMSHMSICIYVASTDFEYSCLNAPRRDDRTTISNSAWFTGLISRSLSDTLPLWLGCGGLKCCPSWGGIIIQMFAPRGISPHPSPIFPENNMNLVCLGAIELPFLHLLRFRRNWLLFLFGQPSLSS